MCCDFATGMMSICCSSVLCSHLLFIEHFTEADCGATFISLCDRFGIPRFLHRVTFLGPDLLLLSIGDGRRALIEFEEVYVKWTDLVEPIRKKTKTYHIQYCIVRIGSKLTLVVQGVPQQVPFGGLNSTELIEVGRVIGQRYRQLHGL
jgi:hypothetical protein